MPFLFGSPLNPTGIGATEDDVLVLWLKKGASVIAAVKLLEDNASAIGLGEIYYGPTLALNYNVGGLEPGEDPRSPDIIVTPNVGVTYSGSTTMIGDHGGFAHDDTNVMLLVSHPHFAARTVSATTRTAKVAPTILQALGLDPNKLEAVKVEGTQVLPEVAATRKVEIDAATGAGAGYLYAFTLRITLPNGLPACYERTLWRIWRRRAAAFSPIFSVMARF